MRQGEACLFEQTVLGEILRFRHGPVFFWLLLHIVTPLLAANLWAASRQGQYTNHHQTAQNSSDHFRQLQVNGSLILMAEAEVGKSRDQKS